MCECLKREDGTWHVDECCAFVMDAYHDGRLFEEALLCASKDELLAILGQARFDELEERGRLCVDEALSTWKARQVYEADSDNTTPTA